MGYEESVIDFMKQMWSALLHEAVNLLQLNDGASHIREALENISSLGVWFTGPDISLPLRRYTVQVPNEQGGEDSMVVVGLLSFSYSSYIMQLRSISQQTTLSTLASLQEQLGTKCLFIPPLLIASKD
ncbi:hypothetical protein AGDE_00108 [Angomonas deanei]|nr:hypothetical protein AGDE_00108 [Angomonas deanei]|eukprot:EPY43813.1 hypothetical protein AGDE_00108 [Angomonas deanei]